MDKISTAQVFFENQGGLIEDIIDGKLSYNMAISHLSNIMIGFAKLHVQAALKAALVQAEGYEGTPDMKRYILNSYPLTNIQ